MIVRELVRRDIIKFCDDKVHCSMRCHHLQTEDFYYCNLFHSSLGIGMHKREGDHVVCYPVRCQICKEKVR